MTTDVILSLYSYHGASLSLLRSGMLPVPLRVSTPDSNDHDILPISPPVCSGSPYGSADAIPSKQPSPSSASYGYLTVRSELPTNA